MPFQVHNININTGASWHDIGDDPIVTLNDCSRFRNLRVRPKGRIYLHEFDPDAVNLHLPVGTPSKINYSVIKTVTQIASTIIALWLVCRV